jgi:hypothetical protein
MKVCPFLMPKNRSKRKMRRRGERKHEEGNSNPAQKQDKDEANKE